MALQITPTRNPPFAAGIIYEHYGSLEITAVLLRSTSLPGPWEYSGWILVLYSWLPTGTMFDA